MTTSFAGHALAERFPQPHELSGKRQKKLQKHIDLFPIGHGRGWVTRLIACDAQHRLDHIEVGLQVLNGVSWEIRDYWL
jgi:hypothetical protein